MKKDRSLKVNVILNSIKQICSALLPLITIPYISRTLQADNYGKYSFANSIAGYITLIAGLGIQAYAVREGARIRHDKEKFARFSSEVFTINVFTTTVAYACLLILSVTPKMQPYKELLFIQSCVVLFTTIGTDWVNTIYEDYGYLTIRYLIFQVLSIAAMFILVREPNDYLVYAAIVSVASAGANILNIAHVRKYTRIKFVLRPRFKKHMPPILLLFANQMAVTIYVNSDITLLGLLSDDYSVGIYSVASKIYAIIKQLLNAVVTVAVPRLSALLGQKNEPQYIKICNKILNSLITVLMPAIVGLFFTSEYIIRIVGGTTYEDGAVALKILSLSLLFATIACFYTNCILLPFKMDKALLSSTIAGAVTNILLNMYFIPKFGVNGAAMTTVVGEAVVCICAHIKASKIMNVEIKKNTILSSGAGCFLIAVICMTVPSVVTNWIAIFAVDIIFSIAAYFVCLLLLGNDLLKEVMEGMRK